MSRWVSVRIIGHGVSKRHASTKWIGGMRPISEVCTSPSRHRAISLGAASAIVSPPCGALGVIQGKQDSIYFSGDSGYGPHFKEIGAKYGPFDFAMMECGQYNEKWPLIHMMPEETAQAAVDLGAKAMMPIHWGTFVLAMHSWTDPVERVTKRADELGMPVITPRIGDVITMDALAGFRDRWWEG